MHEVVWVVVRADSKESARGEVDQFLTHLIHESNSIYDRYQLMNQKYKSGGSNRFVRYKDKNLILSLGDLTGINEYRYARFVSGRIYYSWLPYSDSRLCTDSEIEVSNIIDENYYIVPTDCHY
jgi:hypothetical protein